MPVNPGFEYQRAEAEYIQATTLEEKLAKSKKMLQLVPKHKGSENLIALIRKRIAKLLKLQDKQKQIAKRAGRAAGGIKKEGAARVCLIGTPNSGKSTLLAKLTNAKPLIADYPFTTKRPELGTLDYEGIKIQIIEIPAITKDYLETEKGQQYMSIVRESELLVLTYKDEEEKKLLIKELKNAKIKLPFIECPFPYKEDVKEKLWKNLGIIRVYTKQPGKQKDFPPVALKAGATVKDLAKKVHKDFLKQFKFAKIYGKSAKFKGQQVGINHKLADEDIVELYIED